MGTVDPEPEMLNIARTSKLANVQWIEGSSYDLGSQWGSFRLVTMGRSFHWMERQETLRRLEGIIEPGGAIALFHDNHPMLLENTWWQEYRALIRRYTLDGKRRTRGPDWVGHESILLDSTFSCLEEVSVIERREVTVDALIERALSMSSTSVKKIAGQTAELAKEVGALMASLAPSGRITELVATQALIATRE